jgi:hypothetical protein
MAKNQLLKWFYALPREECLLMRQIREKINKKESWMEILPVAGFPSPIL